MELCGTELASVQCMSTLALFVHGRNNSASSQASIHLTNLCKLPCRNPMQDALEMEKAKEEDAGTTLQPAVLIDD